MAVTTGGFFITKLEQSASQPSTAYYLCSPGQRSLWRMEAPVAPTQPSCVPLPIAHTGDWINSDRTGTLFCKGSCQ
jgi:hypothetical protein